ncbi:Dynamin-1-like protein [Hypsibius exemplaris]|uniref:Dynamin-1-like protein n=1 Tax=Hypsibius exemplaris TaxID=2072580 RepID=A0A1W0XDM2_HYPEX|nr:Dynamin-1-like protein [Hypsibius exemplaris]
MEGVGNEIWIVNQLQDVFKTVREKAVLESIVGWDFLPRGSGIVTRCPLFLQLMYVPQLPDPDNELHLDDADHPKFAATFSHKPDIIFTKPSKMRQEIEQRTNEIAGKGKNVVHERIVLKISSPSFIDLTLVDLPGLMKNPVGDQPLDIEDQTKELIMSYISNENSLILAITPMNADMSIELWWVLTKLDIMDNGTHARKEMMGQVLPFKLGIIGITNRTQMDIEKNKTIKMHLEDERKFFEENYKDLAREHGIPYFAKKLNKVLMAHIRERMQDLRKKLEDAKANHRNQLQILGEKVEEKSVMVNQVLKKFSGDYCESLVGSTPSIDKDGTLGSPIHGPLDWTKINDIFHGDFAKALGELRPLGNLVLADITNAIEKCGGLYPTLFVPEDAFRQLIEKQIESFKSPAVECVKRVHEEMEGIIDRSTDLVQRLLDRFPNLRDEIYEVVRRFLESRHDLARDFVEELVDNEMSYIDTKHPQFYGEASALVKAGKASSTQPQNVHQQQYPYKQLVASSGSKDEPDIWKILESNALAASAQQDFYSALASLADVEKEECEQICKLVYKYFLIVRQTVQTGVPKGVVHRLVRFVKNHIEEELVKQLYDPDRFNELLRESQHTATRRTEAIARLKEIDEGLLIIRNVRNHKLF